MKPVLVASLFVLAGCASIDPARGHSEVGRAVQQSIGVQTGWENGTPEDEAVKKRVDDLLAAGLTRRSVLAIALVNNRRLQATYEQLGVAQAEMVQAGLLKNPSFSGSIGFPVNGASLVENEFAVAQDFLDLFLLPLRKRIAGEQFAAEVARVTHESLTVAAEASNAFTDVLTETQKFELQKLVAESEQIASDLALRQRRAGNITELELSTQQASSVQAQLELGATQQRLLEGRERLNRILGLFGPQTEWKLAESLAAPPAQEPALDRLESRAIRNRYDLLAAKTEVALFDEAVSLARTSRATGFVEIGIHTHQDPDGPRLTGPTLSLELPIFDQRTALIARLEAQQRQASRSMDALAIEIRSEVRLARARLLRTRAAIDYYRNTLLPLRERVMQESQLQYNAMQLGLYALLAAKQAQATARSGYLEVLREYWTARTELERAIGGRLDPTPESRSDTQK